jgi:dihydropteroate synthase
MGILNVTPDSFSDGGRFLSSDSAIAHGLQMAAEGADWIDVGGESTRPGALPVSVDEELERVLPVVAGLASRGLRVSIDTMKPAVAREAVRAGASLINDVTGWNDPEMGLVCAESGAAVCLMHMQGEPRTMQAKPTYANLVEEIRDFLVARAELAQSLGIESDRIYIDPGIGFGKTIEHNLDLLRHLAIFVKSGYPVLLGTSRKSFIGRILGSDGEPLPTDERLEGTLATQAVAEAAGVAILRVHDVQSAVRFSRMYRAITQPD